MDISYIKVLNFYFGALIAAALFAVIAISKRKNRKVAALYWFNAILLVLVQIALWAMAVRLGIRLKPD